MSLTVRDHMTLQLATARYKYAAVRVDAIRDQLGMSEPVFWRRVTMLLDRPEAEAAYPSEVRRLRRLRDLRRSFRSLSA